IVASATRASRVLVFDHTLRVEDEKTRKTKKLREPVRVVHNDYTDTSGPQRIRDLLPPDEAEVALTKRYVYVNVWRSINGAVEEAPLGICDAKSIAEGDMILMDLKYGDRVGEIHRTRYNPNHQWVYFPRMVPDEIILLKCYDSRTDVARWTAHTAFDDPTSPADAAPRQSIETRTIAFYE
ncbi:MAG TPA: methyltransferase, partial [Rhodospirillaceae bacterium]|nr:methyltransferase [Rhodospirillaceae bacterium]